MYLLEIELEGLPAINTARNWHWRKRKRHDDEWKRQVAVMCLGKRPPEPLERAELECVRFSSKEPDCDNLAQSFKPLVDALVDADIIRDDRPSVIGSPTYRWQHAPAKSGRVLLIVRGCA